MRKRRKIHRPDMKIVSAFLNSNMTKPILPSEVAKAKKEALPDEVLEAINELIAQHWNGHSSTFKLDDAVKLAVKKLNASKKRAKRWTAQELFDNGYLDVEDTYRKSGWKVVFDKPGYCESYDATFCFSKK